MNTSSRVPGITRNSGWRAVNAEIASSHLGPRRPQSVRPTPAGQEAEPAPLSPERAASLPLQGLWGAGSSARPETSPAAFSMAMAG